MIVKSKKLITLSLSVIDDLRIKLIIVLYTFYTVIPINLVAESILIWK